jgi:hypothetical protein
MEITNCLLKLYGCQNNLFFMHMFLYIDINYDFRNYFNTISENYFDTYIRRDLAAWGL